MDFSFVNIDSLSLLLLAISLLAAAGAWMAKFLPVSKAGGAVASSPAPLPEGATLPSLSVIVYSSSSEDELIDWLHYAMTQDYPHYEVIVVYEGSAETTASLSERLLMKFPSRLYVTFIPPQSHNLSRRKLAFTIGMKAASGDVVLTTSSDCRIPSSRWLSEMMSPFALDPSIDVVLGYSHPDYSGCSILNNWYRRCDATLSACRWIGAAAMGRPFRGDSNNLAFRRECFFNRKGYSKSINLVDGDDDIFLHEFMTGFNTALAVSPDSILSFRSSLPLSSLLADIKERYQFTERLLPSAPFLRDGAGSLLIWLMTGTAVAAALSGLPDFISLYIAAVVLLAAFTVFTLVFRRASCRLGSRSPWCLFPLFLLWHPFGNFFFRMRHRRNIKNHFTFS